MCGYITGRNQHQQDNWLFTQHISKNISAELNTTVFVNVTYKIDDEACNVDLGCKRLFELYYYVVNFQQSRRDYYNISRYTLLSIVSPGDSQVENVIEEQNFTLSPQQSAFYIAIRDIGTCMSVSRITVYNGMYIVSY